MNKIILSLVLISVAFISQAQVVKLSGPRVGATIVTPGSASDFIQNDLMMPGDDGWGNSSTALITQYGWQLETRFIESEEVSGLVEWVFLVGGMERGLFLPSVSSLFGMRAKSGLEGAIGPNLSLTGVGMVLALGYTFKTGTLNVPINLSFVPGKSKTHEEGGGWDWDDATGTEIYVPESSTDYTTGSRISLTLGFNLAQ